MARIYKTSRGTPIDMEALRHANEHAVALGNMKVNAKGDMLGKGGEIIKTAKERIAPSHTARREVAKTSLKPSINKADVVKTTEEVMEEPLEEVLEELEPTVTLKTRADGSQYNEIMYDDGSIVTEEVAPAPKKKTKTKSKQKKGSI
jgi:hypothetical protein